MRTFGSYMIVVAPVLEPVTLADAKAMLNIYHNDDDVLLAGLISAAREMFESETSLCISEQTWDLYLDGFPPYSSRVDPTGCWPNIYLRNAIELEKWRVSSVASVKYYDGSNSLQTLDPSLYTVTTPDRVCRVTPVQNFYWPQAYVKPHSVIVRFTAGYGATCGSVPADIKTWISNQVLSMYEARGTYQQKQMIRSPVFSHIVSKYRLGAF